MRFLVDANLPPALARWLVSEGHDAEHVSDLEMERTSDRDIWAYARERDACIVTKDEDSFCFKPWTAKDPLLCGFASATRSEELY